MRFGAHQTFHLRSSWLHKGLKAINQNPQSLYSNNAIEELGMGKNMVESLKYWLEATQLAVKEDGELFLTEIANDIFNSDPYLELDGSLQLIHYLLATNEETATVWQWFFNKFSASEFEIDSINVYLQSYISANTDKKVKDTTLGKDINCLLRMYKSENYDSKYDPETNNPSPFSRFNWIEKRGTKFLRREVNFHEISNLIFVYSLYLFWHDELNGAESINIEEIATKENSPGLVFGLSINQCLQAIEEINRSYPDKYFTYNKSGGYFILNMIENSSKNALKEYFKENQMDAE